MRFHLFRVYLLTLTFSVASIIHVIQATFSQTLSTFGGHESLDYDYDFRLAGPRFQLTHVFTRLIPSHVGGHFYLNHLARFPLLLEAH